MRYDDDGIAIGPVVIRPCSASEYPISELDGCVMEVRGEDREITITWQCDFCHQAHTSKVEVRK